MKSQLFLLQMNTCVHSIFTLSSLCFVILTSLNYHNDFIDIAAFFTFFSFFVFGRCILIDSYNHIKQDLDQYSLPFSARDNITRDFIKSLVGSKKLDEDIVKEIEQTRLDIIGNIDPFLKQDDSLIIADIYNRKIQYIVGNIIIGMLLMTKYNAKTYTIIIVAWLVINFPL